jgi:hypothetical protein
MDSRDGLHSSTGGIDCAVCGRRVPTDRVRVLARRDDISFVEIDCRACRSESLGIVVAGGGGAAGPYGEFLPADHERFREALPIGADDVLRVHDLLRAGDLTALVDGVDVGGPSSEA